jgi:anhydro-N-acetylmuramic acid kinase
MNKIARLEKVLKKTERRIIGLISGMSMDGVDLALVTVSGSYPDLKITLEDTDFLSYPDELLNRIRGLSVSSGGGEGASQVSQLNVEIGEYFSELVNRFLEKKKISPDAIDAIGSHGQTVYHDTSGIDHSPSTLQLGSGAVLAERTGILTVYNFRERDLAAGGVGAPLVPLADYLLFREPGKVKTYTNLGSISNVTLVTESSDDVLSFDIGPANMPIDFFSRKIPGNDSGIDLDSQYSSRGTVIEPLLQELRSHPYFSQKPPKALGFREFGNDYLEALHSRYAGYSNFDLVRTMVELCAVTVADGFTSFIFPALKKLGFSSLDTCTFTGGGSRNILLMDRIAALLPSAPVHALSRSDERFSDAKEAVSFAILANELLSGRPGSLPGVTGVAPGTLLGSICP